MTERNPDRKIQLHGKGISPISGFLITFRWFAVTASGPRGQLRHRAERQGCLPSREKCGDAPSIPEVRRRVGLRHPKASLWASRSLSGTQRPPRPAPPTAQALSKAGGASCPDTQGARQPPSKADEASPTGLAPQPAFGGPGISGRLASRPGIHLTPPATALITRVGPAGQRPAARGQSPWCQIKDQAEGRGGPRYKLPPPEEPRGPGPAAPPGPEANWKQSRGQCRGRAALRRWPAGSSLCVQSSLRMRSAAPVPLGPGCFPSGDCHSGLGARLC